MQYNKLSNQRILSIDAFRGITIIVMIFVNEVAGMRDIPSWMKHMPADADAMSFVDVVFPAFLFIVGMAIPFAINSRLAKGDNFKRLQQHILFRTLGLLVLGVFMVNAEGGYDEALMRMSINVWALLFFLAAVIVWKVYYTKKKVWVYIFRAAGLIGLIVLGIVYKGPNEAPMSPKWWGILGLIGWAYLYSCIIYQLSKGNRYWLAAVMAFCMAFYAVGSIDAINHSNWFHWISAQKGNASHTSIVLSGMVLTLIFFEEKEHASRRNRFFEAAVFTCVLFIAGFILRPYFHISKIYATPTWALYSAGFFCIVFGFLYWLIEIKKAKRWSLFLAPVASNPLLAYIIPDIVYFLVGLGGMTLFPYALSSGLIGILWSMVFTVLVLGFVKLLTKWRLKLQL